MLEQFDFLRPSIEVSCFLRYRPMESYALDWSICYTVYWLSIPSCLLSSPIKRLMRRSDPRENKCSVSVYNDMIDLYKGGIYSGFREQLT